MRRISAEENNESVRQILGQCNFQEMLARVNAELNAQVLRVSVSKVFFIF